MTKLLCILTLLNSDKLSGTNYYTSYATNDAHLPCRAQLSNTQFKILIKKSN